MQTECINELLDMDEATGKWVMKPDKPWFKEARKRFQIPIFMDVFATKIFTTTTITPQIAVLNFIIYQLYILLAIT